MVSVKTPSCAYGASTYTTISVIDYVTILTRDHCCTEVALKVLDVLLEQSAPSDVPSLTNYGPTVAPQPFLEDLQVLQLVPVAQDFAPPLVIAYSFGVAMNFPMRDHVFFCASIACGCA